MSLSNHLRDASSPVRIYMDRVSPILTDTQGRTSSARASAGALGLVKIAASTSIVPVPPDIDAARSGTAFDIRTRIALGGFDVRTSSVAAGVNQLSLLATQVENGQHRAQIISEAFTIAESLLQNPSSNDDLNLASILLAHGEQIYRAGPAALNGALGTACDQARDGQQFVDNISPHDLRDLDRLFRASSEQISRWKHQIDGGIRFDSDLGFDGSSLVGGADADWLIGDTLIDCKVYGALTVSRLRDFLRQLLGYVMLDLNDVLKIRHVGIWLPRQGRMQTWSLSYLLDGDPEKLLPKLRDGFIKATGGEQLGIYQPVTQRRKDQLLAENLRTPTRMLEALANYDDRDIRFKVARNAATPERTVRTLAKDRYARVREGVAMNTRAPADVVENLHDDKSMVVRRAAAANPGALRSQTQALTSGNEPKEAFISESSTITPRSESDAHIGDLEQSNPVQIKAQRDDWVLDSRWILMFLRSILSGNSVANYHYLFPRASRIWADHSNRRLEIPHQLLGKLPDEILADLFRRDRPALVRQAVASSLPVEDRAVRDALLNDMDPEIRWSALRRSADYPDETMAGFLAGLAASRSERIRFRTNDEGSTDRTQRYTPSELDDLTFEVIAAHPSTPPETLRTLIESKAPEVLTALAQNQALQAKDRETLVAKMKMTRSSESRRWFAESSRTPPEVLKQLAGSRMVDMRFAVATNRSTSVDTLIKLSVDPDPAVRAGVLSNPKIPNEVATATAQSLLVSSADRELEDVLASLSRRTDIVLPAEIVEKALDRLSKSRLRDPDIRRTVTRDDRTSGKTLKRLANSTDDGIREDVARHDRTPVTVLSRLAQDPSSDVRRAVAGNPITDEHTLLALSNDEDWLVRRNTARNPTADQETLRRLLSDDNQRVRKALLDNPSLSPDDARKLEAGMPRNSQTPRWTQDELYEMAASKHAETRMRVAYSLEATPDILSFLSGQRRNVQVRRIVAAHPRTAPKTLWALADDDDVEVRQAIALNDNSPADLLAHLAGMSIDFALLVVLNPDAPPEVLDALTSDSEALVQFVSTVARADRALGDGQESSHRPALDNSPAVVEVSKPDFESRIGPE